VRKHHGTLITDTTWRDAHQSLLATRLRTRDILKISEATGVALAPAYSLENWVSLGSRLGSDLDGENVMMLYKVKHHKVI
jgi:pyruvate carboxylase